MREIKIDKSESGYLVFVRLVESCNLKCKHCLIPANPKRMTLDECFKIPELLEKHIPLGSNVTIKWHGGEPTLFGASRLKKVMDFLLKDARFAYRFEIRTNLMKVNSEWVELFKKYFSGRVGVSWDYQIRELSDSAHYDELFFRNMDYLVENDISPMMAITVTKLFLEWFSSHTLDVISWIHRYNLNEILFLRLIKTGRASENWDEIGVSNKEYSEFIIKTFKMQEMVSNVEHFGGFYPICEYVDVILNSEKNSQEIQSCFNGWCDSNSLSIDENGIRLGCLTMESQSVSSDGDLYKITVDDIVTARHKRMVSCDGCVHSTYCNTGCFSALRHDQSGECSGGSMVFNYINKRLIEA